MAVQTALNEAYRLEGEARGRSDLVRWGDAVSAAERAEGVFRAGSGDAALRSTILATLTRLQDGQREAKEQAESAARDIRMIKELEEAHLQMANLKGEGFDKKATTDAYEAAFRNYGVDIVALPEAEATKKLKALDSRMHEPIAAVLDDWSGRSGPPLGERLLLLAGLIDPDPTRSAVRMAVARRDVKALKELALRDGADALPKATLFKLGTYLRMLGAVDEAAALLRRGQARHPGDFWINQGLGYALYVAGTPHLEESIRFQSVALALRSDSPAMHTNLGEALRAKGKLDEAIAEHRRAIALKPDFAMARNNLGSALHDNRMVDEAIAEFRRSIELNDNAHAHYNLAIALREKGHLDEAIAENRRTIALLPDCAEAHCNLGWVLFDQGQFAEALAAMERGHELGSKRRGWEYPSANWILQFKGFAELEGRLPAVLKGNDRPKNVYDWAALADVAYRKGQHAASAGLWRDLFLAAPGAAENPQSHHRWWAARVAALAGSGKGKDHPPTDENTRAQLRKQARDWLQADLNDWGKLLDSGLPKDKTALIATLQEWKTDPNLAGLRDQEVLARLPAAERQVCLKLWAEVETLLAKARADK
jgi:tetratricopeptide (TPR) repeat protein